MFKKYLTPLLISAALPSLANAEMQLGNFSAGVKLGMFMVDSGVGDPLENVTGQAVDVDDGFGFGLHGDVEVGNNCFVDFEYTRSSVDAETTIGGTTASSDIDIDTFAVYGGYRSPGNLYYLGKLGLIHENVDGEAFSENEMGLSFAVGGGYRFQENFSVELEFTSIEEDVGFVGLTGRYTFK